MYALSTEQHSQTTQLTVATDIARHLAEHVMFGKAVIVTNNPGAMLSRIKQAWRSEGPRAWPCSFAVASPGDEDI